MLEKYFKGFPEKQALKGTLATVVAYKMSKMASNKFAENFAKGDTAKVPTYEFIGSALATVGSIALYTKIKAKDIGFGLVLGSGLNTVDKLMLLPAIKKSIPESMQPLFSGEMGNDYQQRIADARMDLSEDDVQSIINAAKVNGYLDGFGGSEDAIYITPEERAALIEANFNGYDPDLEEFDRPGGFGGSEEYSDLGSDEFA
ncbi:MAG: hypothetical protein IPL26_30110 [Leptospiraceae bacterium]|nr:hypothetical protein [Leptospiraceae bacterium]